MSALDWPAASGYYQIGTTPAISDNTWSFVAWIRTNVNNVGGTIISGGDVDGTSGFYMGTSVQSGTTICVGGGAKATGASGKRDLADTANTWSNLDGVNRLIALTCDGTNFNMYTVVKGAACGSPVSATILGGTGIETVPWRCGGYYPSGVGNFPHFGGEVAFFDYTLSEANLTTLAAGVFMLGALGTDPVCYWRFRWGDVATEANVGTGSSTYSAAKNGSSFGQGTDFFADSVPRIDHPVTNRQLSR